MRMLTEEDVRQKLDPVRLIAALESAFRDRYPSTEIPLRTHINLDSGIFLLMPCYDRARDALGMKLVTVHETPAHPEERLQATYILFDSQTASPKLIVPANYLTDLRTAATSAVATKSLARETAATLGIFGTGRQARAHLRVLPLVRNFQRVLVCGRTRHRNRCGQRRDRCRRVRCHLHLHYFASPALRWKSTSSQHSSESGWRISATHA